MTEETVTKKILSWLNNNNWNIVCFDFPQSGTGVMLHPNNKSNVTKNKDGVIPDIIAVKEGIALFFENKNRFFLDDFKKLNDIKTTNIYSDSLSMLLKEYQVLNIYYGVGAIKNNLFLTKAVEHHHLVDFIVLLDNNINDIYVEKDDFNLF